MKNKVLYAIVSLLALTGCGSMKNMSREDRAGVGAQIGAFVGWLRSEEHTSALQSH